MFFLIEYNRPKGELISISSFEEAEREWAEKKRLEIELKLNQSGISHEVVLLEAESQEALRRTHRRYFENSKQIGQSINRPSA